MFFTYILYSERYDKYYIGYTNEINQRIERHNNGFVKSTKPYRPWRLVYKEVYKTKSEALKREKYLKSLKSKVALKQLVDASR